MDTVVHGVTGIHVLPRDPVAAAPAVQELLADRRRRQRMGSAGRERARRYTWPAIAAAVECAYHRAAMTSVPTQTPEEAAG
jgi:D-inositol-3-phosphate glycosyltransferase